MNNEQMKQTLENAQGWINSAKKLTGELSRPEAAGVCAQIAIAQALSVIAATLVSVAYNTAGTANPRMAIRTYSTNQGRE